MRVASELRVVLLSASTGAQEWKGLLCDFFAANSETLDTAEKLLVLRILNQGGVYYFGGGSGPLFHLKVDQALGVQAEEVVRRGPACGHSACSQNYIDTGETQCVLPPDIQAEEEMESSYYAKGDARDDQNH